jgi:hypothetical protein
LPDVSPPKYNKAQRQQLGFFCAEPKIQMGKIVLDIENVLSTDN